MTTARPRLPEFGIDPLAWVTWADEQLCRDPQAAPRRLLCAEPATWRDPDGNSWRIVVTEHGPELRPALVAPFLRFNEEPLITALRLSDPVSVELTTAHARWVGDFPAGTLDLRALAEAMLEQRYLPHDNITILFPGRPEQEHPTRH